MWLFWWVAKWIGTIACVLLLLVTATTLIWKYVNVTDHDVLLVGAGSGGFGITLGEITPYNRYRDNLIEFGSAYGSWEELRDTWSQNAVWSPRIDKYPGGVSIVTVPLWIPFVLFGVPTIWLWWRQPRRLSEACCEQCGYDLTGNMSGQCPECGTPLASKTD